MYSYFRDIRLFLFCVRARVGFEPQKVQNKQKKMSTNNTFLWNFYFCCECKGLATLSYYGEYFLFSFLLGISIIEKCKTFAVSCPYYTQRWFCFLKLVCFLPWLAGKFHNFELTRNRKNKKWSKHRKIWSQRSMASCCVLYSNPCHFLTLNRTRPSW
jgi:hypothetical protein